MLTKPSGRLRDFLLTEFPLRMLLSLYLARDTHFLLILSFKVKSGSEVKKAMSFRLFSSARRDGLRRLSLPLATVTFL
jgi:hypothetical protein